MEPICLPQNLSFASNPFLGDGDSKVLDALEAKPYGDNVKIETEECINHVEKRMMRGLNEIQKNKKISGGKGMLVP